MRPFAAFILLVCAAFLSASSTSAQEAPQSATDLLKTLVGEYEYAFTADGSTTPGVIALQPFAHGHYLILDEISHLGTGEPLGIKGIIGYDVSSGHFTWYRVFSHGAWDRGVGRLQDGELVVDIVERYYEPFGNVSFAQANVKSRTIWKGFDANGWTFVWEQSVDDGPWEWQSEGRNRRITW